MKYVALACGLILVGQWVHMLISDFLFERRLKRKGLYWWWRIRG